MKTCEREGCNEPFEPRKPNQRFHSQRCQERAWRERHPRATVHVDQVDCKGWINDDVTRVELIRPGHPLWHE